MAVGKQMIAMGLAFLMIGLGFILNYTLIPKFGLTGAALATSVTGLIGAFGGVAYLFRRFGQLMRPNSLIKIVGVSLAISIPCVFIDIAGIWLLMQYLLLMVLYFVLLLLLKEIGSEEWTLLKRVFVPSVGR